MGQNVENGMVQKYSLLSEEETLWHCMQTKRKAKKTAGRGSGPLAPEDEEVPTGGQRVVLHLLSHWYGSYDMPNFFIFLTARDNCTALCESFSLLIWNGTR